MRFHTHSFLLHHQIIVPIISPPPPVQTFLILGGEKYTPHAVS